MSIAMLTPRAIEVDVHDRLEKSDYGRLTPVIERALREHPRIGLVVDLRGFGEATASALWEDLKFDVKHYDRVERLAVVGQDTSEHWMATVSKPFTTADVRYFDAGELDRARAWASAKPARPGTAGDDLGEGKLEGDVIGLSNARGDLPGPKPRPGTRGHEGIEVGPDTRPSGSRSVPPHSGATDIDLGADERGAPRRKAK